MPAQNRRSFVKTAALAGAGLTLAPALARAAKDKKNKTANSAPTPDEKPIAVTQDPSYDATGKPNVLMIAIDDLRAWVNYLGYHQAKTPNMDRLAAMGMAFSRAYCPAPICNPSRTALLTGLRPSTTGVYDNTADWRENKVCQAVPTLPVWLRQHGYAAYGAGKIYHDSFGKPSEWDGYATAEHQADLPAAAENLGSKAIAFRPLVGPDSAMIDYQTADHCIEKLQQKYDKPFLLGCGFHKPHTPWDVPQKYYDMYPLDQIELPKVQPSIDDIPPEGVTMALHGGDYDFFVKSGHWKDAVRAQLAAITFMDTQLGRVVDALEKSAHKDNTLILLWVDHGWHHGEKHHWRKYALWEEATQTPVIWAVPGMTKPGSVCARTVDHMGIYPTLCDVLDMPLPKHLEGVSYRKLLENPEAAWDRPAICTYEQNNHTVRTERWRYIRYTGGGEELYDHDADPLEWKNLAADPQYAALKQDLAKHFPKINVTAFRSKKAGKRLTAAEGGADE